MDDKFSKPYNPQETEDNIYKRWLESGLFNPDACVENGVTEETAETFSMVLPPPNVTGTLHVGHATMLAIQDIYARYNRMQGKRTLWLPGTDHAAIATQSKVEKELVKSEGKNRHDLGREEFLGRVENFAQESHDTIVSQVEKMGASLDWSREAYTLDETRQRAVREAFVRMYEAGLIYRGDRIVNWDPKGQTTISDDEIVYEETKATLYTFRYSKDFPIPIATTRPETKVGDTAVAVHPEDKRYKKYIGQTFEVESFIGTPLTIQVIGDDTVDPEYGTGALGVTPAHSHADWDIAERHNLPKKTVINQYAKIVAPVSEIDGLNVRVAREKVAEWLRAEGLMEEEKEVDQNLSRAERSNGIVEPLPMKQWFVAANKRFTLPHSNIDGIESGSEVTLKELMLHVVRSEQIDIIPDRFEKTYFHWIENLRDWCISRQLWFGHRIPAWYKDGEVHVGHEAPEGEGWEQDSDTLDTWFSSGLWTFSTLGWPEETADLKTYHPTTLLETGYDILFFWVARMILMSSFLTGEVPFKTVYLHGLVRDEKGRKMSKSLGNILDPVDLIDKYGADATRMALVVGTTPGNDSTISESKVKAHKHFANKIWNATRFVLMNTEDYDGSDAQLLDSHQTHKNEFSDFIADVTGDLDAYRFSMAGEKLYSYFWHTFADVIIEETKEALYGEDETAKRSAQSLLTHILTNSLVLLHPFMPFVTEDIWSRLPQELKDNDRMLLVTTWPTKQ